jgi:hypothetical protein
MAVPPLGGFRGLVSRETPPREATPRDAAGVATRSTGPFRILTAAFVPAAHTFQRRPSDGQPPRVGGRSRHPAHAAPTVGPRPLLHGGLPPTASHARSTAQGWRDAARVRKLPRKGSIAFVAQGLASPHGRASPAASVAYRAPLVEAVSNVVARSAVGGSVRVGSTWSAACSPSPSSHQLRASPAGEDSNAGGGPLSLVHPVYMRSSTARSLSAASRCLRRLVPDSGDSVNRR